MSLSKYGELIFVLKNDLDSRLANSPDNAMPTGVDRLCHSGCLGQRNSNQIPLNEPTANRNELVRKT